MRSKIVLKTNLVSVEWLKAHLDAENLVILDATIGKSIDAESSSKLKQLPNALFFDIKKKFSDISAPFPNTLPSEGQFEIEAENLGINSDTAIIVYDDKGIYSSARAWWLFKSFGHANIAVLDGGLPEWNRKGGETEKQYPNKVTERGYFKATLNPEAFTNLNKLQKFIENKSRTIIDARSSERFNCQVPEPREGLRSGTIPESLNIPFLSLLENGKFKPKKDLKAIFSSIAASDQKLVLSCGSGITACVLALGATLIGYDNLTIYDGSWTEYGTII